MKVAFFQPCLPHYRIPFFDALGSQPDVRLTVFCGEAEEGMADGQGHNFTTVNAPLTYHRGFSRRLFSQNAMTSTPFKGNFDVVVFNWNSRFTNLPAALQRAAREGVPSILWGHGYSKRPGAIRSYLRNRLGRLADAIVLYDKNTAKNLVEKSGFRPDSTFVAPNSLGQTEIAAAIDYWQAESRLSEFRKEHNLKPKLTLIFVSRLLRSNRADMLIDGFRYFQRDYPEAKLIIVGSGPELNNLRLQTQRIGLSDAVVFTGAIYDESELAPWMLSSTLFCYPVNIGLSLLHAFSYGLPVVTSDDIPAHNPEIVAMKDNVTGRFYKNGDTDDMVNRWREIVSSPTARLRMSYAARRTVEQEHSIQQMVNGFSNALRFCVQGRLSSQSKAA